MTGPKRFVSAENQNTQPNPHCFVMWKNTDIYMDFECPCGCVSLITGSFAYAIQCPDCKKIFKVPSFIYPIEHDEQDPGNVGALIVGEDC